MGGWEVGEGGEDGAGHFSCAWIFGFDVQIGFELGRWMLKVAEK